MISLNFLYYSLGIGFLVLVGFISFTAYSLSESLKKVSSILVKVDDVAKDANQLKDIVKTGILYFLNMFIKKGGDKNGKTKQ